MRTDEPGTPMSVVNTAPTRVSLIRSIFSSLPLDSIRAKRTTTPEGILAPRTPVPTPLSPLPHRPSSPALRLQNYPAAPPRSPGPGAQEFDSSLANKTLSGFQLRNPPVRPMREGSLDSLTPSLSMRRNTSYGSTHGKND